MNNHINLNNLLKGIIKFYFKNFVLSHERSLGTFLPSFCSTWDKIISLRLMRTKLKASCSQLLSTSKKLKCTRFVIRHIDMSTIQELYTNISRDSILIFQNAAWLLSGMKTSTFLSLILGACTKMS